MTQFAQIHATNLVVMIAAGGKIDEVLEMAKAFQVRAIHLHQLVVNEEQEPARKLLIEKLSNK